MQQSERAPFTRVYCQYIGRTSGSALAAPSTAALSHGRPLLSVTDNSVRRRARETRRAENSCRCPCPLGLGGCLKVREGSVQPCMAHVPTPPSYVPSSVHAPAASPQELPRAALQHSMLRYPNYGGRAPSVRVFALPSLSPPANTRRFTFVLCSLSCDETSSGLPWSLTQIPLRQKHDYRGMNERVC